MKVITHRHKIAFSVEGSGAPSFSPFEKRVLCFIRMSIISRFVKHIERSECGKDLRSDETQHCSGSLSYTVLLSCSQGEKIQVKTIESFSSDIRKHDSVPLPENGDERCALPFACLNLRISLSHCREIISRKAQFVHVDA